jgi:hypothetical protein
MVIWEICISYDFLARWQLIENSRMVEGAPESEVSAGLAKSGYFFALPWNPSSLPTMSSLSLLDSDIRFTSLHQPRYK